MSRQAGFTLLEVLVAVALLGVLIALLAGSLVSANRATVKAEHLSERLDQIRAAQRYLRSALSQALPLAAGSTVTRPRRFIGEAQRMTFHAALPASVGGGVFQQRLALTGDRLLATFDRLDGPTSERFGEHFGERFGEPQVVLTGVRALAFSYHGRSPLGQDSGWVSSWPWPDRLPRAVRIAATLAGVVPWVTEQVNLRLDLDSEPGER